MENCKKISNFLWNWLLAVPPFKKRILAAIGSECVNKHSLDFRSD